MKKAISAMLSLVFACLFFTVQATAEDDYAPAMETKAFDVFIDVKENNVYDITTIIKVNFNVHKHGIYYYIPYKGEIVRQIDGQIYRNTYNNRINRVRVEGYKYEVSMSEGSTLIKIGSGDSYVFGEQIYKINYRCTVGDDKIDLMDDVYWNFFPLDWETPIESGKILVRIPKEFDESKLDFTGGFYGEHEEGLLDYKVEGNVISGELTRPLQRGEGVTMRLTLPEGYFVKDNSLLYIMSFLILAVFGIILVLWFLFGRDEKALPVVSFYPPKGMSSADTGYIIDGFVDDKDLISLLIFWASKGHITITQTSKHDFLITKRKELDISAKPFERTMFRGLFDGRNSVSTKDLKNSFYQTMDAARLEIKSYYRSKGNELFTKASVASRIISGYLFILPVLLFLLMGLYHVIAEGTLYAATVISIVISLVLGNRLIYTFDKRKAISKFKLNANIIVIGIILAFFAIYAFKIGSSVIGQPILAAVSILFSALSLFFATTMKRRTEQSRLWMSEILGLKEFIRAAELDRIKMLVDENPEYFYNVLPFAYVFGLTDKWAEKFENIAIRRPDWYVSDYPGSTMPYFNALMFTRALDRGMSTVKSSATARPSQSGGGSGGFSSGGGFSGGGMGGGGGGSW
ncbi:MAG TPA: DUF2207 domain-containing protein [Oscillospiraceae bacterium]|nr:DUF2207 domain-containing protein [Oscillospiraceae bacterium]